MDFSDADLTPEIQLNEIVWRSVKGPDFADAASPPQRVRPPSHRTAGALTPEPERWSIG